ncbi:MAG: HDOD domain-containing protein [Candidatus Marinimicrobia bacterium]|nr:HDOD domain-containing protein [Candidatus Neomarinimicrobiota bacterium]
MIFPTAKKDFGQHNIEPMLKPDKAKLNKIKQTSKGVSFPTIPDIVTQLDKETQKTNVDMNKIGKLVSKDPIIAGAIVKTINSPLFASKVKITSISHATMMMGLNNFRNMIISALVKNIFEDENENINNIWVESLIVAKYCAEISKLTEGVETDEAYMLGLFRELPVSVRDSIPLL